jgi:hypothetical protein
MCAENWLGSYLLKLSWIQLFPLDTTWASVNQTKKVMILSNIHGLKKYFLYSTLLILLPLRFHFVGECWD